MLSRETLWNRFSGVSFWPLAWALAAAAGMPWLIPESWNGTISVAFAIAGWTLVGLSSLLLRFNQWVVVPLTLALAWGTLGALRQRVLWESQLPKDFQTLEGQISAPWTRRGDRLHTQLRLTAPASLKNIELPLSVPGTEEHAPPPAPGTPVRFRAELQSVEPAPLFLPERPLWRARSDEAPRRIRLNSTLLLEPLGPPKPSLMLCFRLFVLKRFEALNLSSIAKDLWGALVLGIPPVHEEAFTPFTESGTIHILIVSGLQVTLVIAAAETLLRRLRRGTTVVSMVVGLLYCVVVGFSAPVWRGLLMGTVWVLGRSSGWKVSPVLALHGGLLIWLMTHPAAGCEPGFLLAWWALLGLLWAANPLAGLLSPLLGKWSLAFARLFAPWFTTLPLLAIFFGGIPLWGVLANLLVLPLVTVLTPLCLLLTLLPLSPLVQAIASLLTWIAEGLLPILSGIRPTATGFLWPWIFLTLGWLILAHRYASMKRVRAWTLLLVMASSLLVITMGTGLKPATLGLEAIDIGQGDALLLRVPKGDATLIDTGPSPWAARRIVKTLSRRGVREPLQLVLTHPHSDHAGGWATLSRLWPIHSVSLPATSDEENPWSTFSPTPSPSVQPLLRGQEWRQGKAAFSVRWPPKPFDLPDANMVSMVLRVRWQDRELWFMGDALAIQEQDLLDLGDPGKNRSLHRLLKVGHHGSRSASNPAWIGSLRPEVAIITAGRNNRFAHPHQETLKTLAHGGILAPWITGISKGIHVEARPEGWRIETGTGSWHVIPHQKSSSPQGR